MTSVTPYQHTCHSMATCLLSIGEATNNMATAHIGEVYYSSNSYVRCVKQDLKPCTYTGFDTVVCSITLQTQLQDGQAPAAAGEQQASQLLIISGFGLMKLLETLDKQPLHGSLLGSTCLQARQPQACWQHVLAAASGKQAEHKFQIRPRD